MNMTGNFKTTTGPLSGPVTKSAVRGRAASLDAITLLTKQHREIEALFAAFECCSEDDYQAKEHLFTELSGKLDLHTDLEESYFYPAVQHIGSDHIKEAEEDHREVKLRIDRIDEMTAEDDGFSESVLELKGMVEEHIEEEEGAIFPLCRRRIDARSLEKLGAQMLAASRETMFAVRSSPLSSPASRSSEDVCRH